jgi:hypothetical protein
LGPAAVKFTIRVCESVFVATVKDAGAVGTPGTNRDAFPDGIGMFAATAIMDAMATRPMAGRSHLACFFAKRVTARFVVKTASLIVPYPQNFFVVWCCTRLRGFPAPLKEFFDPVV